MTRTSATSWELSSSSGKMPESPTMGCGDATQPWDGSFMSIVASQQEVDVSQSRRQRSIPRWCVTPVARRGTTRSCTGLAKRAEATTMVPPRARCNGAVAVCWKYSEKCSVGTLLVKSQHGCDGVTLKGFILVKVKYFGIAL